jgi:hypothetical protein
MTHNATILQVQYGHKFWKELPTDNSSGLNWCYKPETTWTVQKQWTTSSDTRFLYRLIRWLVRFIRTVIVDQLETWFVVFERASLILPIKLSRPRESISTEHESLFVCNVNSTIGVLSALTLLLSNANCVLTLKKWIGDECVVLIIKQIPWVSNQSLWDPCLILTFS